MGYSPQMGMGYSPQMGMGYSSQMGMGYTSQMGMGYSPQMGMGYTSQMGYQQPQMGYPQPQSGYPQPQQRTQEDVLRQRLTEMNTWLTSGYQTMNAEQNLDYVTKLLEEMTELSSWNTATQELFSTHTKSTLEYWIDYYRTQVESQTITTSTKGSTS